MAKLIIIRGNSGSGKTSLAKLLQRKIGRNTMLISQDNIRRDMLWVKDGKDSEAIPLLINLLRYGAEKTEVVILEGILTAEYYQPVFEQAIKAFDSQIFAYYYDIPFDETIVRHQTKNNKFDFGEIEMKEWWVEKDYIKIIEEHILNKEISLSDAVDLILQKIKVEIKG